MTEEQYLIRLNAPLELEMAVTDFLLAFENTSGFNSFPLARHHHLSSSMTLLEQVDGKQKRVGFEMCVTQQRLLQVKEVLKRVFNNSGIFYQVLPIIEYDVL